MDRISPSQNERRDSSVITSPAAGSDSEAISLPGHLVEFLDQEWALWRWVGLRGAGFPAVEVLRLAAPECAAKSDLLNQAEDGAGRARQQALKIFSEALDKLRSEGHRGDKARRNTLLSAVRFLKVGKLPASFEPLLPAEIAAVEAVRCALTRVDDLKAEYKQAYEAATIDTSQTTSELARADRFREAVVWQNRQAYDRAFKRLTEMQPEKNVARNKKQRRDEELVANYLQRYCVKNDTIGFFGPVGWAILNPSHPDFFFHAGPQMLAARQVYFEGWALDALVATLNKSVELRPWCAPRRFPFISLVGDMLHFPMRRRIRLPAKVAAVLRLCAGDRTALQIARAVIQNRSLGLGDEREVYTILEGLREQGLILWEMELPLETFPERRLRGLLERVEDERLRRQALARLDELEQAKEAVSNAAGDVERLDAALEALERKFTALTGESATRAAGRTYAARTLVYEDCRRNVELEVGKALIGELSGPLGLLLKSARWFMSEAGKALRKELKIVYRDLVKKNGGHRSIEALGFWIEARAHLFGASLNDSSVAALDGVQADFQQRWAEILGLEDEQWRAERQSRELMERVEKAFAAPWAGWSRGQYHSPDVMIAAESIDAIRRGDYLLVMGEFHMGRNTLSASSRFEQHPDPPQLIKAVESDLPKRQAIPMILKESSLARTNFRLISPDDYRIEFEANSFTPDRDRALPIAELVVEEEDQTLITRTRDRRLSFDLVEIFGYILSGFVVNQFKLIRPTAHTPRITIDRLVVARETWRFTPSEMSFAEIKDESERFAAARRFASSCRLPRFVFVKVPVELKPFYVDFTSPAYINLLSKMVRRTAQEGMEAQVAISEMLPSLEQIWLPDAEGNRYTSELRIVALDLNRSAQH